MHVYFLVYLPGPAETLSFVERFRLWRHLKGFVVFVGLWSAAGLSVTFRERRAKMMEMEAEQVIANKKNLKELFLKKRIGLLKEAMKQGGQEGMQTFDQAIYDYYTQGKITYETAIAYADSANDLRLRIKAEDVGSPEEEKTGKSAFRLRSEVSRT